MRGGEGEGGEGEEGERGGGKKRRKGGERKEEGGEGRRKNRGGKEGGRKGKRGEVRRGLGVHYSAHVQLTTRYTCTSLDKSYQASCAIYVLQATKLKLERRRLAMNYTSWWMEINHMTMQENHMTM